MKKITYICDVCGEEIEGNPIKITPEVVDQDENVVSLPDNEGELWAILICEKDFCCTCFKWLAAVIVGACSEQDEEPETTEEVTEDFPPDKPIPEGTIDALIEKRGENTREFHAKVAEAVGEEPEKRAKTAPLDHGKIMALHKAGWSPAKIADEMGCAVSAVYRHIKKDGGD